MKTSLELERREKQISKWKIWIRKKHQPKMKMPLHRTKCQSAKTSPQAVIITLFQRTQVNPIIRTTKVSFIQSITQITDQNPKIQLETPNRIMEPAKPTTRKPELSTKGSSRNNVFFLSSVEQLPSFFHSKSSICLPFVSPFSFIFFQFA